jgi:quinol monooxygenase YgiN
VQNENRVGFTIILAFLTGIILFLLHLIRNRLAKNHATLFASLGNPINVFTVEPANQQQLLELLARATETSVRHAPGFVSSSLHRCLDGTKVTMYAQWRSVEDYQAMRANPAPLPYLQQALAIARFEPGMYEVVEIFSGTSSEP